jgi:hypothetical protein
MEMFQQTGNLSKSALRADMDPKTARKYLEAGKLPSEIKKDHTWRTRPDPFEEDWDRCAEILADAPDLEAKFLFEWLCEQTPGMYQEGQLRTFQRRVGDWRALHGPDREVFFAQEHEPGERMATDCTSMNELGITIQGEGFAHLLCHCVLSYSNWEWGTVCHSESMLALRVGIQRALLQLGRIPREHWTDNSSAATHRPGKEPEEEAQARAPNSLHEGRVFNQDYQELMKHFRMRPRTIQVSAPHENGDVESLHGVLKRRLKQHLLLRGSADFQSEALYVSFLEEVMRKANAGRTERLKTEVERMRLLDCSRLAEYDEHDCKVYKWGTLTVQRRIYSVPSRLMDKTVRIHRYEDRIEVFYKGVHQLTAPWVSREQGHCINYRHLIESLVRKPGAFRRYRFRHELFPCTIFRWAYDRLDEAVSERTADREYLQILHHAARTMQSEIEAALVSCRADQAVPRLETVLARCPRPASAPPPLKPLEVKLGDYDKLLESERIPA